MSEFVVAIGLWLPLGTVVPLVLSKLTGSDWRGAFIEASIFAIMGVLIFPILFALSLALIFGQPNVDLVFAISYALATVCVLLIRRRINNSELERRYGTRG